MTESITHFHSIRTKPDDKFYLFPNLRIVLISKGTIKWLIGKKEYICNKGDIIFLNNSFERKITDVFNKEAEIDVFEFSPLLLAENINLIESFYDMNNCVISNKSNTAPKITGFLKEIQLEIQSNLSHKNEYIENLLKAALILSLRGKQCSVKSHIHTDTTLKATLFIWNNLKEKMNSGSIAKEMGVKEKILEANFKKLHGRSVSSYIRMCRVNRVTREIKNNSANILDIALENGFTSSSGFYKTFNSIHKMSPKEYLKTIR